MSAMTAPPAPTAAPKWKACGRVTRTGGRSASPLTKSVPALAISVRSVVAHPALGPSWPYGVTDT